MGKESLMDYTPVPLTRRTILYNYYYKPISTREYYIPETIKHFLVLVTT